MASALDQLLAILDLERIEENIFRGRSPDESVQRVFGGQVAGQSLIAAGRTVEPARRVHSLHAYFLRPGDPTTPIIFLVERLRDGRSFTTRRVRAVQHGQPIFLLSASFQLRQDNLEHQATMPAAPDPETVPTLRERFAGIDEAEPWVSRPRPFDLRYVTEPATLLARRGGRSSHEQVWLRTTGPLPDDHLIHVCALTYASDLTLLDSVLLARGISQATHRLVVASLDHAMWFHRPFRADEWLLYDQASPSSAGSRGLARGDIWTRDGRLAVSVVQEGMVRQLGDPGEGG